MNRKFNPVIAVGAVLLLVGVVVLAVLAARGDSSSASTVKALVAQSDVPAGPPAAAANLKVQDVSAKDVPAGSPSDPTALAGKFATARILKGQVITAATFGQVAAATSAGVALPKGKQALGVELGFAPGGLRYVVPGNKINVYVAPKAKAAGDGAVHVTPGQVLVRDLLVLRTTPGAGDGNGTAPVAGAGNLDFLLAVSPQEAAKLIAAQAAGHSLYVTLSDSSR